MRSHIAFRELHIKNLFGVHRLEELGCAANIEDFALLRVFKVFTIRNVAVISISLYSRWHCVRQRVMHTLKGVVVGGE